MMIYCHSWLASVLLAAMVLHSRALVTTTTIRQHARVAPTTSIRESASLSPTSLQAIRADNLASENALSPLESWCVIHLNALYSEALTIRCPFWKRRASDVLDGMDQIMRFLIIRHKSLPLVGPPASWRSRDAHVAKTTHLTTHQMMDALGHDWKVDTHKGYYITGRLNTTLYRDDCFFDGPDPDMPVRGLRKYLSAASQLFDPVQSRAELLSLESLPQSSSPFLDNERTQSSSISNQPSSPDLIVARWKISGVLRLPWKPNLPEWTGSTTYYRDEQGLIYQHVETWDVSVMQAFLSTFWPDMAQRIWPSTTMATPATPEAIIVGEEQHHIQQKTR